MYIVTGATGQTGSVVAKILLDKGLPVRVIVRSEEKRKLWKESGADVAVADVQDEKGLTKAFEGGKVLYLMNPPNYQSEDMVEEAQKAIKAFKTAVANSSLEKLVVLSSIGAHLESGTGPVVGLHLLEQAFNNSRMPVTFLRPPSFLENWNSALESVKDDGVLPSFHSLDKKYPQISTDEIGRIAAETMLEDWEGVRVKELAGKSYSPNDVAGAFSKILGKQVNALEVPRDQWLDILRGFNSPRNAEIMAELFDSIGADAIPFETSTQVAGKLSIDDYAGKALKLSSAQTSS